MLLLQNTLRRTSFAEKGKCPLCCGEEYRTLYRLPRSRPFPTSSDSVVTCLQCHHIYLCPIPSVEELKEIYESEAYWQVEYFKHQEVGGKGNGPLEYYENALEELEKYAPGRGELLDVGCAMGVFLNLARRRGWRPTGVDPSRISAQRAREWFDLSVTVGELEKVQFPSAHFDAITLWDVLEHLRDPVAHLQEIWRILKEEGFLLIQTMNVDNLLYQVGHGSYRLSLGVFRSPIARLYPSYHLHYFTEQVLHRLLKENRFQRIFYLPKEYPIERSGISGWTRLGVRLIYFIQSFSNRKVNQLVIARKV